MFTYPCEDRDALLSALVMSAIADDYENFAMVAHEVTGWAAEQHVHFADDEIWFALRRLIELDLARAYRLAATLDLPVGTNDITPATRGDSYFLLTPRGHAAMEQGEAT